MAVEQRVKDICAEADINVNGERPWDVQIHAPHTLRRWALHGSIGLGESYVDGDWDCEALDDMIHRLLARDPLGSVEPWWHRAMGNLIGKVSNLQTVARAFHVGEHHYDIGDDLYGRMLDRLMTYSCGFWQAGAGDLDEAQEHKLRLTCEKLGLEPGMRVLDIGCGWGSFAYFAAKHYGVAVVGLTISKEQQKTAQERCRDLPVDIRFQDYRTFEGTFDRIVSIGMFEHVGPKNYQTYLKMARRCLVPDGRFLLHTIGTNRTEASTRTWYTKYIFPNGYLPSIAEMSRAMEDSFIVEDLHNFGPDYDRTLMAWYLRFDAAWGELRGTKPEYDDRFYRMWRFYLLSCAGGFRARSIQLWQWVLSPNGVPGGYRRPALAELFNARSPSRRPQQRAGLTAVGER